MKKETPEKRSQIMKAVKGKNTSPEVSVRKVIFALGYRFRLHAKHLPGNPDIYFPKRKKVIFVNGCFWHGHECSRGARVPKNNQGYWREKIRKNILRDKKTLDTLRVAGWHTLVIWECDLKNREDLENRINSFLTK